MCYIVIDISLFLISYLYKINMLYMLKNKYIYIYIYIHIYIYCGRLMTSSILNNIYLFSLEGFLNVLIVICLPHATTRIQFPELALSITSL